MTRWTIQEGLRCNDLKNRLFFVCGSAALEMVASIHQWSRYFQLSWPNQWNWDLSSNRLQKGVECPIVRTGWRWPAVSGCMNLHTNTEFPTRIEWRLPSGIVGAVVSWLASVQKDRMEIPRIQSTAILSGSMMPLIPKSAIILVLNTGVWTRELEAY